MRGKLLEISLFGACIVRSSTTGKFEITGSKQKVLFALLVTAPFGRRTRAFLQDTLWGTGCYDSGRQSLRRALSDIKKIIGSDFSEIIKLNNSEVAIDLDNVKLIGQPGRGEFLEGLDLLEEGYNHWLRGIRVSPEQIYSLFSPIRHSVVRPIVPAVTIIPFKLVTGDKSYRLLGDWMAEEICRTLSRSNLLSVISHLSSRSMASRAIDIDSIKSLLNVDFCITGSVRIVNGRVIVDADFIDTSNGRILWTRQFSGTESSFIEETTEGIGAIVRAIGQSIADESVQYVKNNRICDLEDHRLLVAGVKLMHQPTLRAFAKSRELIEEAIRRSPTSAEAYAWRGKWYVLSVFNGWSSNPAEDTLTAVDCTARALDLNSENSFCLTIDGFVHNNLLRRMDIASSRYNEAIRHNPNEALSWLLKGALNAFSDKPERAVDMVEQARRLSPLDPFQYYYDSLSASAYLANDDHLKALELAENSYQINDRHSSTLRVKISALYHLDRVDEARVAASELLNRHPDFTVSSYLSAHPAAESKTGVALANALYQSGIPN